MNDYDLRCSWCDQRFPDKQARIHHEQEEHGTVTDEQVNRIMSGQDKLWDTHRDDSTGYAFGPGLNVTVPRAQNASETRYDPFNDGITEADLTVEMRAQGLGLPPVALVTAGAICQQAADITAGDRQTTHGDKVENHKNISALWSAYLGVEIAPYQAAGMMVLLKLARTQAGAFHVDDYVDMAGYAGCMAEIRHRSNQEAQ